MITVYEIKSNGFIGVSKQIDPKEGISTNWTYTAPPDDGVYKWENSQWVEGVEPDISVPSADLNALAETARTDRNALLIASDWTQVADAPVDKEAWASYRQQLRDVTLQSEFPLNVIWPEKP